MERKIKIEDLNQELTDKEKAASQGGLKMPGVEGFSHGVEGFPRGKGFSHGVEGFPKKSRADGLLEEFEQTM